MGTVTATIFFYTAWSYFVFRLGAPTWAIASIVMLCIYDLLSQFN